jgi:hypothetical protein
LIPVYNGKVLTPEQYEGIYSIENLKEGICSPLNSEEIISKLYDKPNDLFRIDNLLPITNVACDLDRLSKRLTKGLFEKDWDNLARLWYWKGIL